MKFLPYPLGGTVSAILLGKKNKLGNAVSRQQKQNMTPPDLSHNKNNKARQR